MTILEITNLDKTYGFDGDPTNQVKALENINLEVRQNEFLSIVGPTGCGKSTLLEIIAGLRPATSGAIYVKGELADKPLPAIGVVFQEESVFPWRTTMANVEFGLEMRGENKQERRRRCQEAIKLVGLSGFEQKYPSELSGGMRQRTAIARTLVMNPEIMLMDEPFGALDEQTRMILGEELLRIWEEIGQTIVFITHSINEAVQLSDRVVVMTARPGRIKAIFDIDLGRPRDSSIVGTERFNHFAGMIWKELREESIKGFKQSNL
jgi:NitT/TauT family transport system ATP-binding protein